MVWLVRPVVNAGYASVSFFVLPRALFWGTTTTRAREPVSWARNDFTRRASRDLSHLPAQPDTGLARDPAGVGAHTHAMFWSGMVLSPLLLQG